MNYVVAEPATNDLCGSLGQRALPGWELPEGRARSPHRAVVRMTIWQSIESDKRMED